MRRGFPRLLTFAAVSTLLFTGIAAPVAAQKGASPSSAGAGGQGGGSTPYFETEMLAYGAVNQLSEAIAQEACAKVPRGSTLVIFDQSSFQNLSMWQSLVSSAGLLTAAYNTVGGGAPASAAAGVRPSRNGGTNAAAAPGPFIQGGADLGSLITALAASTANNASTFTIQDSTMAVSIIHAFERANCNVNVIYYPLFGAYADLDSAKNKVASAFDSLNQARTSAQAKLTGLTDSSKSALPAIVNDLNIQYDSLLKLFISGGSPSASPSGGGQGSNAGGGGGGGQNQNSTTQGSAPSGSASGYSSLLQGAQLEDLVNKDDTYILYADVVAAGGTQRDIKNVFTLVTGDWISYSGGLIVNIAAVKAKETHLVFADTLRYRTDFTNIAKGFSSPRRSEIVENANEGSNEFSLCNEEKRHHFLFESGPSKTNCPIAAETRQDLSFSPAEVVGGTPTIGTIMLPQAAWRDFPVKIKIDDSTVCAQSSEMPCTFPDSKASAPQHNASQQCAPGQNQDAGQSKAKANGSQKNEENDAPGKKKAKEDDAGKEKRKEPLLASGYETLIGAGSTTGCFILQTQAVTNDKEVHVYYEDQNKKTHRATLKIIPLAITSVLVSTSSAIAGGPDLNAAINLNGPAPAGAKVQLSTDPPGIATTMPSSADFEQGARSKSFNLQITGPNLRTAKAVTLKATLYLGQNAVGSQSFAITVSPKPPPVLTSCLINPTAVTDANTEVNATVNLSDTAPVGAKVKLLSSNQDIAVVKDQTNLTVPGDAGVAGVKATIRGGILDLQSSSSQSFKVTINKTNVKAATTATLTAILDLNRILIADPTAALDTSTGQSCTITVTPSSN